MAIAACQTCGSTTLEYLEQLIETRWCPASLQFVHVEEDQWQVEPILWPAPPAPDDPFGLEYMNKIERAA